jgi:hypothetical protein
VRRACFSAVPFTHVRYFRLVSAVFWTDNGSQACTVAIPVMDRYTGLYPKHVRSLKLLVACLGLNLVCCVVRNFRREKRTGGESEPMVSTQDVTEFRMFYFDEELKKILRLGLSRCSNHHPREQLMCPPMALLPSLRKQVSKLYKQQYSVGSGYPTPSSLAWNE